MLPPTPDMMAQKKQAAVNDLIALLRSVPSVSFLVISRIMGGIWMWDPRLSARTSQRFHGLHFTFLQDLTESVFRLILKNRGRSESARTLVKDAVEVIVQAQILPLK